MLISRKCRYKPNADWYLAAMKKLGIMDVARKRTRYKGAAGFCVQGWGSPAHLDFLKIREKESAKIRKKDRKGEGLKLLNDFLDAEKG